jgi:uncharacterized membrane protein
MIVESYFLIDQIKKWRQEKKIKEDEKEKIYQESLKTGKPISLVANGIMNTTPKTDSSAYTVIGIFVIFLIAILLALVTAYFLFKCVQSQCMSFVVFLLVIVFLNIPILNIAVFIFVLVWYFTKCKKGCASNGNVLDGSKK